MNHQLVIIGNGFDLSHGLNLKYTDFLINYFHKCLFQLNVCEDKRDKKNINYFFKVYSDELLTIETQKWTDCGTEDNSLQNIKRREWYEKLNISNIENLNKLIEVIKGELIITFKKDFSLLEKILELSKKNWVDFESFYFDCLVEVKEDPDGKIESINTQWDFLKSEFIGYLKYCQKDFNSKRNEYNSFKNFEVLKYLFDGHEFGDNIKSKSTKHLYLNFNFTNVLKFLYNFEKIIQIHGNIDEDLDDILFGYGFTQNENYSKIVSQRDNGFRINLKDIYYSDKKNKPKLFEFLKNNSFDVKVIGHSCGESDITLLNKIFGHDNCKSIKIYSRDRSGFQNIRNNIYRFPFSEIISDKIIPYEDLKNNIIKQFNPKFPLINYDYKINS